MIYQQKIPDANLSQYVNSIWYFESYFLDVYEMNYLPKHTHFITISFDDIAKLKFSEKEEYQIAPITLGGFLDKTTLNVRLQGKVRFIGIDLKPFGFYQLTKQSCDVFVNQNWDMGLFIQKSQTDELYEKLLHATEITDYFNLVEEFLFYQFNEKSSIKTELQVAKIEQAIHLITTSPTTVSIDQIASELAISNRNLQRMFKTIVGISPKNWADTYKFQFVLNGLKENKWKSLEDAAYSCGFSDISHFCKFFKVQTSYKPSEILLNYDNMYKSIFQYDS